MRTSLKASLVSTLALGLLFGCLMIPVASLAAASPAPKSALIELSEGSGAKARTSRFVVGLLENGAPSTIEVEHDRGNTRIAIHCQQQKDARLRVALDLRHQRHTTRGLKHATQLKVSVNLALGQRALIGAFRRKDGSEATVALTLR